MDLYVVAALLFLAASVRGDGNCSVAKEHFSRYNVTLSDFNDRGGEVVCFGGGQCCSRNDVPALDHLVEEQMSAFLNQALSSSHTALKQSMEDLDGAVCWKLNDTSRKADRLLAALYNSYYLSHSHEFDDFFCKLSAINQHCENCYEAVAETGKDLLRKIILLILKAAENVSYVFEDYERCVFRHSDLKATFGGRIFSLFISRLQKGICNPCLIRKGLEAAAALVRAAMSPRLDCRCKQKLRCMQSCSCCSGSRECVLRPCYNCCIDALTPCMSPDYTSLHPKFSRTIKRLRKAAKAIVENTFDPDYLLQSLSVTLSEVIMNAYNKQTTLSLKMTAECGHIRAHMVSQRPQSRAPAVTCPPCPGNVMSIKIALSRIRDDLINIRYIFRGLKHNICSKHAAKPDVVEGCDSCSQCKIIDQDRPSYFQLDLEKMMQDIPGVLKKERTIRRFAI